MNRNQKIAIGCGAAGCLGLILLVIVGIVLMTLGYLSVPGRSNRNRNYNFNSNSNSNRSSNGNSNASENSNSNSSDSSTMSEDDKHKLFQAAGITKDSDLIQKVLAKIGFASQTGSDYADFIKAHFPWAMKNLEFIQSVNTPEKGRAYVEAHIHD